jgi:uncharacterized protein YeaO (DUF488 family)
MPLKTKRWNDPRERDDGYRLLICRYRPRGVRKADETWDAWCSELGPSRKLHADFYGKHGPPIGWEQYRNRYLEEMKSQHELIDELGDLVAGGGTITLLCSSACEDASHCHRTLLAELIEKRKNRPKDHEPTRETTQEPAATAEPEAATAPRGRRKKSKTQPAK